MPTNDYFDNATLNALPKGATARAESVDAKYDAITTGLDKLPTENENNRGTRNYAVTTGSAGAYVVTLAHITAYNDGQKLSVVANHTNPSGGTTVNVSGLGNVSIFLADGNALPASVMIKDGTYDFRYSTILSGFILSTSALSTGKAETTSVVDALSSYTGNDVEVILAEIITFLAAKVAKSGDTMTGELRIANPTTSSVAALQSNATNQTCRYDFRDDLGVLRGYVLFNDTNGEIGIYRLSAAGATETFFRLTDTGNVSVNGVAPLSANQLTRKDYVDSKVAKSGDTMTGDLTIVNGANPKVSLFPDTTGGVIEYRLYDTNNIRRGSIQFIESSGNFQLIRSDSLGANEVTFQLTLQGVLIVSAASNGIVQCRSATNSTYQLEDSAGQRRFNMEFTSSGVYEHRIFNSSGTVIGAYSYVNGNLRASAVAPLNAADLTRLDFIQSGTVIMSNKTLTDPVIDSLKPVICPRTLRTYAGEIDGATGNVNTTAMTGISFSRSSAGIYVLTHSFGDSDYSLVVSTVRAGGSTGWAYYDTKGNNAVTVKTVDKNGVSSDESFSYFLTRI